MPDASLDYLETTQGQFRVIDKTTVGLPGRDFAGSGFCRACHSAYPTCDLLQENDVKDTGMAKAMSVLAAAGLLTNKNTKTA